MQRSLQIKTSLPSGYENFGYQVTGVIFPTDGCWQIEAQADSSVLRFVVYVEPAPETHRPGSCENLAEAAQASDAIIVGHVMESEPHPSGYVWQTVRQVWTFKPTFNDTYILQDTRQEVALQEGHTYLLFLQRDPWHLFCPERTLAEVVGSYVNGKVIGVDQGVDDKPLWSGRTPEEVETEIKALLLSSDEGAEVQTESGTATQ